MKYKIPRGTKDILPDEIGVWQCVEDTCRKIFMRYNYSEIRTPILESTELFARSIGGTTDIVTKEMYTFLDKAQRSLTLRPEETAGVVRACLENNLIGPEKLVKLYYIGPMFRYERPQAGRFRQFHQAGVEVFGSADPLIDVEVIELGVRLFEELGLLDLEVDINSVGCKECKPAFRDKLKAYFKDVVKRMCKDCQERFKYNPLRILDCKERVCQKYIEKAPASLDSLCLECKTNFEKLIEYLKAYDIRYRINDRLVRGLDYYTRTTFEIISKVLGAQNAVCGGGRYDTLVQELGGKGTPATGFAIGIERTVEILKSQPQLLANLVKREKGIMLYIAVVGDEAKKKGFSILTQVRKSGFTGDMDYLGRSLKGQMKAADKEGAKYTLIIGDEELKKNSGILRKMDDGSQKEISLDRVVENFS